MPSPIQNDFLKAILDDPDNDDDPAKRYPTVFAVSHAPPLELAAP